MWGIGSPSNVNEPPNRFVTNTRRFSQAKNEANNEQQNCHRNENLSANIIHRALILLLDDRGDERHSDKQQNRNGQEDRALTHQLIAADVHSRSGDQGLDQHRKADSQADRQNLRTNGVVDGHVAVTGARHPHRVLQIGDGEVDRHQHQTHDNTDVALVAMKEPSTRKESERI